MKTPNHCGQDILIDFETYDCLYEEKRTDVSLHICCGAFRLSTLLSVAEAQQLGKELARACLEAELKNLKQAA